MVTSVLGGLILFFLEMYSVIVCGIIFLPYLLPTTLSFYIYLPHR